MRLRNICPYEEDFDKHAPNMKSWFLEEGYSKQIIDSKMGKVKYGKQLKAGSKQAGDGVPFVTLSLKIMRKVSYHSARKLSTYLVRAKLYPLERKRGSYKCHV